MLTFGVQQFRCFHRPRAVRLGKITLLVGENSSGKTSFLAALRASIAVLKMEEPDFNEDPFNLGAYDQIAHHRGRTKAKEFSFEFIQDAPIELRERGEILFPKKRRPFSHLRAKLTFVKKNAQPSLSVVSITCGSVSITLWLDNKERLAAVRTPTRTYSAPKTNTDEFASFRMGGGNLQLLYYFFERIILSSEFEKKPAQQDKEKIAEIQFVRTIFNDAIALIARYNLEIAAPIRTKPKRTYDPKSERPDPEGGYIPYLLARLKAEKSENWAKLKDGLAKFGAAAGLFEDVDIKRKGISDSDPFQVLIKQIGQSSNLIDVGYGVSQILPVLAEIILGSNEAIHLIQQPEVHLHPRAQAEFASFLKDSFSSSNSYCVVETHSDFIVDRIRSHIAAGELKPDDVSLVFFERKEKQVELYQIDLDENGNVNSAPRGYRNFFQKEVFRNLGIENVPHS